MDRILTPPTLKTLAVADADPHQRNILNRQINGGFAIPLLCLSLEIFFFGGCRQRCSTLSWITALDFVMRKDMEQLSHW